MFQPLYQHVVEERRVAKRLPSYAEHTSGGHAREAVLATIEETLDRLGPQLRQLSLDIWSHPETLWEERHAHDALTSFMSEHGFDVTPHYLGLATAWRAVYSRAPSVAGGGAAAAPRVIGINSEMDALPGIGHACGHNLIAMAGVGVALAVKAVLEQHDVPGKIVLLGTPAEEGGNGKGILLERGAYEDMDACIMCHPSAGEPNTASLGPSLARQEVDVEFFGHGYSIYALAHLSAHAGAAPWEGQNALDAAFLAYSSVSVLRQQIKPTHRVHGIVIGKDWAPNIIPDNAQMRWVVRAPTWDEVETLSKRVVACFEAAAHATSCKFKIGTGAGAYDLRQNKPLGQEFAQIAKRYGVTAEFDGGMSASTDFGNVTYALPSLHPGFTIPTQPNGGNHTPQFTEAAATLDAHSKTITVVKALAAVGFRVLDDAEFAKKAKLAWEEDMHMEHMSR
ncbi:uncharacterized protein FIBRA_03419 [Fibroporia radiculosa]|uniref:Peptidase M20 domain-containing protein 2 n=1 Tax=Fibroporia radiculosa TaxID=599839 RepID=J4H2E2_9APHY|nr:uncharacterized protein FIBRA_03419 [Fibroporia radiculosa]CCM01369.1 predicted protein [Fibroporia radiculosa]